MAENGSCRGPFRASHHVKSPIRSILRAFPYFSISNDILIIEKLLIFNLFHLYWTHNVVLQYSPTSKDHVTIQCEKGKRGATQGT